MQSNYVIQAEINIKKHPEWDTARKFEELKQVYEKEDYACYLYDNTLFILPRHIHQPMKIIYEGDLNARIEK